MSTTTSTEKTTLEQPLWTLDALCAVWEHQQSRVNERIDAISLGLDSLVRKQPDTQLLTDAIRAAHMLAGSLGMFGFIGASEEAHLIELGLEGNPAVGDVLVLVQSLGRLRDEIKGSVRLLPAGD